MAHEPAHVIHLDKRGNFACETLDAVHVAELQQFYKTQPWYTDRLNRKPFRNFVLGFSQRINRGIVILGPRMSFDVPPPFLEFFEPIQLGTNDPQMHTLSGAKPTRQEESMRIVLAIVALAALTLIIPLLMAFLRGQARMIMIWFVILGAIFVFTMMLIFLIRRFSGDWFLLPAAVAVRGRAKSKEPLIVLTPRDTNGLMRWVSNGKTTMLVLELWQSNGRTWRRAVSEREAMTFLAAWRCDEIAPPAEKLRELLAN